MYGCEVWNIGQSALHKVNVAWNTCFRRIFCGFYRESVKPLQYFCGILLVSYFVHQRKLLFWKSLFLSENAILASLSRLTAHNFVAVDMMSYRESFLCLQLNIQSGILLLTTSNYRLMFVIWFVVDLAFVVFLNVWCSLLLLLILCLTLADFFVYFFYIYVIFAASVA